MTHLRLRPRDARRIRTDKLKAIPGVLGVLEAAGEVQILLGPGKVSQANTLALLVGLTARQAEEPTAGSQEEQKSSTVSCVVWPRSSSRSFPPSWLAASNAALYAFQDQLQGTVLIGLLSAIS
jgi:PTS system sucrose-specific IIC component